jgi:hypothetical protein
MEQIQTSVKKVRKAARVVHSCVQTQQAVLWIYAMELMTTATLPVRMAQKTRKSEHHVMEQIQTSVKKVRKAARVVHSCVQTQQAVLWIYAMDLMTTAMLPVLMARKTHKSEHHVMEQIQTSVKKVRKAARVVHSCVQTQQAVLWRSAPVAWTRTAMA